MKITREGVIKYLISAIVGAIFWTIAFSPYMIFVVGLTWNQIPSWIAVQFIIVPPLAPIAILLDKKVIKYYKSCKKS